MKIFALLGLLGMLGGIVLILRGMWLRKPNHPSLEMTDMKLSFQMTIRPWRYKEYWDNNGHLYDFAGRLVFMFGCLCGVLAYAF